jgi:CRP-like cAMP-binding protein
MITCLQEKKAWVHKQPKYHLCESLFQGFGAAWVSEHDLKHHMVEAFTICEYPRKHILLQTKDTPVYFYFIIKGLCRLFSLRQKKDTSLRFMGKGELIHYPVYHSDSMPAGCIVESLEDSLLARITQNDFELLQGKFEAFNFTIRSITERQLLAAERRAEMLRMAKPSERLDFFLKQHDGLIGRVCDQHIASYLDMNRSTLNRAKVGYFNKLQG